MKHPSSVYGLSVVRFIAPVVWVLRCAQAACGPLAPVWASHQTRFSAFFTIAVPTIVDIPIAKVVLAVSNILVQFAFKFLIHKSYDHILEQFPYVFHDG